MTSSNEMPKFNRPLRSPDLRVLLTMLSSSSGGRSGPLVQGCRIPNDFGLPGEMNDGLYEFLASPPVPGEAAEAHLWLLSPERNFGRFFPGFEYQAWEGRIVAKGTVIEALNKALQLQIHEAMR